MDLPDKLTFKRSEVTRLTRLDGKVIDFWEKEFGVYSPMVNHTGEQYYTREDVELILKIKQWLIVEKIDKATIREKLKTEKFQFEVNRETVNHNEHPGAEAQGIPREKLKIIKLQLQEILTILDKNGTN